MRRLSSLLVGLFLFVPSLSPAFVSPGNGVIPPTSLVVCPSTGALPTLAKFSNAGSGNFQVVALVSGQSIKVYGFVVNTLAASNIKFVYGTGSACATGATDLTGIINAGGTNANFSSPAFLTNMPLVAPVSQALCLNSSASTTVSGFMMVCQE